MSGIVNIMLDVALKEGEKAVAAFGAKAATLIGAAVASKATCMAINKSSVPLDQLPPEEANAASMRRTIRDASIVAAYSMVGGIIYKAAEIAIEGSDII